MPRPPYEDCVFLNVPFDPGYEPFLRALVFTVQDCGLVARCAREIDNSGQVRMDKICELMAESGPIATGWTGRCRALGIGSAAT